MKKIFLCILTLAVIHTSFTQTLLQYFDGADTLPNSSLIIQMDTSSGNIWQIGYPQKNVFDSSATAPYCLVTDTINTYPHNNTSSFWYGIRPDFFTWGILALRWKQKLDLEKKHDGAIIEFSTNHGTTWSNVFNNPYVNNFYGFNSSNADTLLTGEYAFSGTDSTWKDIWLCFDVSFVWGLTDTLWIKHTLKTDSTGNNLDGWMIDNMMAQITYVHTVKEEQKQPYMKVYPNPTSDILYIQGEENQGYHVIEQMEILSPDGRVIQKFGRAPVKYWIDVSHLPPGLYMLRVNTNLRSTTLPFIVK